MTDPIQRWAFPLGTKGWLVPADYEDSRISYVLAAEAAAHEAAAVAAARSEHEQFCDCYAEVMAERYEQGQRDERARIRAELLSLASERAGVAGRNTDLTGYMRRYLIDLTSVLAVIDAAAPQDGGDHGR